MRLAWITELYEEGQDKCNPKLKAKAIDLAIKETKPLAGAVVSVGTPGDDQLFDILIRRQIKDQQP